MKKYIYIYMMWAEIIDVQSKIKELKKIDQTR